MQRKDSPRIQRVGDQVQRELAEILSRDLADPRVGAVTLSGVEVSKDLRHARVFVTVPLAGDAGQSVAALNRAAGYLRRRLGERIRMKYLPRLSFVHDPTLDRANRLDALIDSVAGEAIDPERDPGQG